MNINRIENDELRHFMERKPDASFREIVEFCRQKFDTAIAELTSTYTRNLEKALDSRELRGTPGKLQDVMEPVVRQTRNIKDYRSLQDFAIHRMNGFIADVDTIANSHTGSFISSLRHIIDSEFDEIGMISPNIRTELDSVYSISDRKMYSRKEEQDTEDRKMAADLRNKVQTTKQEIHKQFAELSKQDALNFGVIYEPNRGVTQDTALIGRITSKAQDLASILKSSNQFFQSDITYALSQNNEGILQEIQGIVKSCRHIMDEAVYQISREIREEELLQEDQRILDNKNRMEAEEQEHIARMAARKREEQELQERIEARRKEEQRIENTSANSTPTDLSNIRLKYDKDDVLLEPSGETYHILFDAGMPMNVISKYIWDGFVRTIDADEKLRFGEITQEAYDKELATIQKIEGILFSELVAGVDFEDARSTAEDVAIHGKEYTPKAKSEDAGFTYSFDNILISASDDTRKILVNAGMPENYVDGYIWDRFVRAISLDSNLENGKISQAEYDEKSELINRIEELLFDGLVQGKTIEEARAVAEDRAAREAAVSIIPSPEAQQALEAAGLSSEDAKRYVWDAFIRTQLIDEALEQGQITEKEKEQQLAKVDSIEKALLDGLRSGKNFSEARRDAETGKKTAFEDISGDTSITTNKVTSAGKVMEDETKNKQPLGPLRSDILI